MPAPADVEHLGPVGRLMDERTTQSWTTVPHYFVVRDLDATRLVEVRERLAPAIEKKHGVRPTVTDLLTAAIARVLRKHPRLNASWSGNGIRLNKDINIGIAMLISLFKRMPLPLQQG